MPLLLIIFEFNEIIRVSVFIILFFYFCLISFFIQFLGEVYEMGDHPILLHERHYWFYFGKCSASFQYKIFQSTKTFKHELQIILYCDVAWVEVVAGNHFSKITPGKSPLEFLTRWKLEITDLFSANKFSKTRILVFFQIEFCKKVHEIKNWPFCVNLTRVLKSSPSSRRKNSCFALFKTILDNYFGVIRLVSTITCIYAANMFKLEFVKIRKKG